MYIFLELTCLFLKLTKTAVKYIKDIKKKKTTNRYKGFCVY